MPKLDAIIFGATGYTGKFITREVARLFPVENLKWAVAGQNPAELRDHLTTISDQEKIDLRDVKTIQADAMDKTSLKEMCDQTKLVINCVGPFRFFGENVIKQCIQSGTHHIDLSGEPEYLERIQLKYNRQALEKKTYIIGSCGFDSVPAEMGVVFTKKNFAYDLNHIESYMIFDYYGAPMTINYGTWESAVYGLGASKSLSLIRKELFKERLPKSPFPLPKRLNKYGFFYDATLGKYCFPFLGSDKSVVMCSEYSNYNLLGQRPVQYMPYLALKTFYGTSKMVVFNKVFMNLSNSQYGRDLLLKHHKLFSFGYASKKHAPIEQMKDVKFTIQFRGVGYSSVLPKNQQHKEAPTKTIVTELIGPQPYIATAKLITNCAVCILKDQARIPVEGGVLTPGFAFYNTTLNSRLEECGFKFNILHNDSKLTKVSEQGQYVS